VGIRLFVVEIKAATRTIGGISVAIAIAVHVTQTG